MIAGEGEEDLLSWQRDVVTCEDFLTGGPDSA